MRLGEFRTKTKNLDNGFIIELSDYDDLSEPTKELDIDIVTKNKIYLRMVKE